MLTFVTWDADPFFPTLFEDAMEKVKLGVTSLAEALSTVKPDDTPGVRK